METILRILIIEDSEDDALLVLHQIRKGGFNIEYERVETAESMKVALKEKTWDIILSDYIMPQFNGLEALTLLNESGFDIPFIIISGTIGEDVAVEMMKTGAHDYIMKNNLQRLLPAIERELRESKNRTERKLLEQKEKQAEHERRVNLHFFESMDKVNRAIQGVSNPEPMMSNVLDTVLTIFDCDRAWLVYPCDPEATSWQVPMEHTRPEYPGAMVMGIEIPMDPEVVQLFQTLLSSSSPTQFVPTEVAQRFNYQSQITMAIHPKVGKPWVFGLHQCSYPRIWTSEEEKLLQEIGRRLTDSLTSLLTLRKLRESEERYRLIAENTADTIAVFDMNLQYTYISPAIMNLLGYTPDELMVLTLEKIMSPNSWQMVQQTFMEEMEYEKSGKSDPNRSRVFITEQYCKDGTKIWVEGTTSFIRDKFGKPINILAISRDITERKQAEEALLKSEERFRNLYENAPIGLYRTTPDGNILLANQALIKMLGYSSLNELTMRNLAEDVYEPTYERKQFIHQIENEGKICNLEAKWICHDGNVIVVRENAKAIRDSNGKTLYYDGIVEDISERKKAEDKLIESEERYKRITTGLTDYLYTVKIRNGKVIETIHNDACFVVTGYTPKEFTEDPYLWINMVFPEEREFVTNKFLKIIEDKDVPPIEHRIICKDGKIKWISDTAIPKHNSEGILISYDGVIKDITERKLAEAELRRLTHAIEQSPVSVVMTNTAGNIEYVNPKFTEITGYTKDEVLGNNPRILKSGEMGVEQYKNLWDTIASGKEWRGEFHNKKKNGELFWETASISPVRNEKGITTHFVAIKEDITERKWSEKALKESEEKFRKLAETASDSILTIDSEGKIISWNKSAERTFGYAFNEVIGKEIQTILPQKYKSLHQTSLVELASGRAPTVIGKTITVEATRKDGTIFPIELSLSLWEANNSVYYTAIIRDISERVKVEQELVTYRNHLEDLVKARTLELDKANESLQMKINKDKEFEMMLQQSLEKEKELSDMQSKFISTTSHEFRTPLTSILSSTDLLQRYGKNWNEQKINEHLARIKKSVKYLTKLLDDILTLSRTETGKISYQPELLDLRQYVLDLIEEMKPLISQRHNLLHLYKSKQKNFFLDAKLLRFIFSNLLINAIKYSPNGGKVELNISTNKKYLIIEVSDEGIGIPDKEITKIFESFYRTKISEAIPGTGLGLAIVKRAVDLHHGEILVNSKLNEGTSFVIKIPKIVKKEDVLSHNANA